MKLNWKSNRKITRKFQNTWILNHALPNNIWSKKISQENLKIF